MTIRQGDGLIITKIKEKQRKYMTTANKRGRKPFQVPAGIKVNWMNTNKEIARQLGVSVMTIFLLRKRLKVPSLSPGRPHKKATTLGRIKEALDNLYQEIASLKTLA